MSYLIVAAVIGVTSIFMVSWLYRQWRLANEGITIRGRVLRKLQPFEKARGPIAGVIKYDFLTPRGEYVENSVLVGEAVCHVHVEGSEIEVVYLKDSPSINGVKQAVNFSREFLRMPPL